MDRYTTPTLEVDVEGVALDGMDVVLTLRQGRTVLDVRSGDFSAYEIDGETAHIEITLTQRQSAMFRAGEKVEVQLNFIDSNGYRGDTEIAETAFGRNLHERVMRNA